VSWKALKIIPVQRLPCMAWLLAQWLLLYVLSGLFHQSDPCYAKRINAKRHFSQRNLVVFAWSGMRGVVSLAAALSIPQLMPDGTAFPHRNLIIYITFCVILTTLILLGFSLPWVIKN